MGLSLPLRRHILLVEDDGMVRETITLMLEDDYEIHPAVSVSTALAHLRDPNPVPIDVVLLDCLLPGGDTAEVLAEADRRSIPVVLISGDPRQVEKLGPARRFLSKPVTQARLLAVLDSARG
ncbi:response regulator [Acidisphaera sp. S103]|uniref:response regulator n=1 Tax=Acidisphaera sp. S103 TaxID=1747223 RepID=UPI00131CFA11|nr:response regulator [Acidisphaera sp. S103]